MQAVQGTDARVFADIGPILREDQPVSGEYQDITRIFIECGATNFLFETQACLDPLYSSLALIKKNNPHALVFVSFAVSQEGYTNSGMYYKNLLHVAAECPHTDIVGLNCSCGPSHMYNLLAALGPIQKPLSAMPNAGYPTTLNGRTVYQDNAVYFSSRLADIYGLGVQVLGGCCGTTPEHIRETVRRVRARQAPPSAAPRNAPTDQKTASKNRLLKKLAQGKKLLAVELDAPLNPNCAFLIDSARKAQAAGADLATIADSPLARSRADSIMVAARVERETGINVLPHLCCRDRNQIGLQAALIAGKMEGLENIFVVTGDPVSLRDRGEYKGVYHFSASGLISFIRHLNAEIFLDSPYCIGGALNPNAANFSAELKRASQKIESGAEFLLTQPVFSDSAVQNLFLAKKELDCNILAGLLPVAGYKNALFLNNEVPGIQIPGNLICELEGKPAAEAAEVSIRYCMEIVKKTYSSCNGYYIITPLKKTDMVCALIQKIRSFE